MKQFFTIILTALAITSYAASNDSTQFSVVKHSQATFITLDDTTGIAIMPKGIAFVSGDAVIGLVKAENGAVLVHGLPQEDGSIKGISVSSDGSIVHINASKIVIVRKAFISHAQADNELLSGEEYYLIGDRIVYRKP